MTRTMLLAALVAATAVRAEDPAPAADPHLFAAPSADATSTAWSCTVETLSAGAKCVFESQAAIAPDPARQAVENAAAAAKLADALCAKAARNPLEPIPDPSVLSVCRQSFAEKAMACGADGSRPLLDDQGRFGSEFRLCYAALGDVLARARTLAASAGPCCRCLVASKCVPSGERCNREALAGTLEGPAARCAADACAEACRAQIPVPPAPPAAPRRTASDPPSPCFDPNRLEVPCARY